ncbi:NAD(P)H-dependent flavin oxidoreductase [Alkaliphilus hydrothermalis]|uniref:Probable nitronate monooxygenase n=1 Tax=Alkaliphilus hydrothermalis TaxID=1482730 RepID=A0ABS2NQ02_9FIRM|nr:nitronate monooxygenase family protein [Alkaliphilus hydrothermalis]MBM7614974.1 NAD(P)H-dependent flavin oxidoreductase YrpB (nitropropane dioxygenase family) [Alkaliphilus hydrothermalis]
MKIPPLRIGELIANVPIIQGGMGVGVSLSKLASAVANEGGIGIISGVQIGFREPDFESNCDEANVRGLIKEIRKARELSPEGILGVNLLVAINNYKDMVKAAVEEKIDLIISGAGLPTDLPALIKGSKTKIAPVVSSGKAAALMAKMWKKRFNYTPDLVIVEGPEAGGHLGFSMEQLQDEIKPDLTNIVKEVIEALNPFKLDNGESIPVIAAGGIFDGADIAKYIKLGAAGVQMSTRFVTTHECDAHPKFKEAYIQATEADIQLVKSPVGMPGRAIRNAFIEKVEAGNAAIKKCYDCLKPCDPRVSPYCISTALINSVLGNTDDGLIFVGSNAHRLDKIVSVKELIQALINETEVALG